MLMLCYAHAGKAALKNPAGRDSRSLGGGEAQHGGITAAAAVPADYWKGWGWISLVTGPDCAHAAMGGGVSANIGLKLPAVMTLTARRVMRESRVRGSAHMTG